MVRKDNLVIEGIGKANFVATNGISKVNFATTKNPPLLPPDVTSGGKNSRGDLQARLKPCPTDILLSFANS